MKVLSCALAVMFASCLVIADDKKDAKPAADGERPKTFQRLIPADVLRGNQQLVLNKF